MPLTSEVMPLRTRGLGCKEADLPADQVDFATVFDNTLGFPGEGPSKMPSERAEWYANNFTDVQVDEIARNIVEAGGGYETPCLKSGYNLLSSGKYAGGGNKAYFRLQNRVKALHNLKKRQENKRTSQMLKDVKQLNALTAKRLNEIQKERNDLVQEKKERQKEKRFYKAECNSIRKLHKERDDLVTR